MFKMKFGIKSAIRLINQFDLAYRYDLLISELTVSAG